MIDYKYGDLFLENSVSKQLLITDDTGDVAITNKELFSQKFELTEAICSEDHLVFGSCEASVLKFTAANIFSSLKGTWLNVQTTLKGNLDEPFVFGRYKVDSDKLTADKKKREYIAYDALHDIINAEMSAWYNALLPEESSTTTLKVFRNSFFSHFGIEQEEVTLINDDMVVTKTIQPEELSGKVVLNAICEINGCFGHIGRNGKFQYIYLEPISDGLYPSESLYPSENLYPAEPNTHTLHTGNYISASYEDYLVEKITKLQIRQEEDDIGAVIGSGDNAYVIQDNFLLYGKSAEDLNTIGQNILSKISGIYYRPFGAKAKGNPCLEVGDAISLSTKYMAVHSYILQRTLTGIQALRDEYTAEGTQYQPMEVNSVHRSIQQLKGKTNKLIRTVDETRLEMEDMEEGLRSEISVTAGDIRAELEDTKNGLESSIELSAEGLRTEVSAKYETIEVVEEKVNIAIDESNSYTDTQLIMYSTTAEMESAIEQKANEINLSVEGKIQTATEYIDSSLESYYTIEEVDNKIILNEDGILLFVSKTYETITDADTMYRSLQSQIDITESNIALKVESDEVQSMIDISLDGIQLTADQISLEGYTTINGGFQVFNNGSVMISSSDGEYSCEVGTYGLNVYRWNSDFYSGTRDDGFFLYDYYDNTYALLWYNERLNRIYIGLSGSDIPCYIRGDRLEIEQMATVNGYAVITAENIGDYSAIPDDLSVNSITGEDSIYSYISMANGTFDNLTAWNQFFLYGDFYFNGNLIDLEDLEARVAALETK